MNNTHPNLIFILIIINISSFFSLETNASTQQNNKKKEDANKSLVYVKYLPSKSEFSKSVEISLPGQVPTIIDLYSNSDLFNLNAVFQYLSGSDLVSESNFVKVSSTNFRNCLFHGTVRNQTQDSFAALNTCDGLRGFFQIDQQTYFIEPLNTQNNQTTNKTKLPHLIWPKESSTYDKKIDTETTTNIFTPIKKRQIAKRSNVEALKEKTIETLIVADYSVYNEFENLNENLETYLLSVFNMVSLIYKDPSLGFPIKFSIVKLIIIKNETSDLFVDKNPVETLKRFSKFQNNLNFPDEHPFHHDLAVLITQIDLCSEDENNCDLQGLANKGTICIPELSANINENDGLSLAFTIAHEIGHNLNAEHDMDECLEEGQNFVMQSFNDHKSSFRTWSKCSQKSISNFLEKNSKCLENKPKSELINETNINLPGLIYSLNKQCQLSNGANSSYCDNEENNIQENMCQKLWCKFENEQSCSANTAMAEGTPCNQNGDYWCFRGECVKMGNSSDTEVIDGEWSEWSDWSECSHSCNSGVQFKERKCNSPPPSYYGKFCQGDSKSYRMCNTQQCQKKQEMFQSQNEQCVKYSKSHDLTKREGGNEILFYFDSKTPCKLLCTLNEYIYEISKQVEDGTRCFPEKNDVCIIGYCQEVGCDFVLNSNLTNDFCGVCNGTNSTCEIIQNEIYFNYSKKKNSGYNYLFSLPKGARNIYIKNDNPKNFLSLKDAQRFYLNGDFKIQYSRIFHIENIKLNYSRADQETIEINGPLKFSIHVMFLLMEKNSNISYVYSIENSTQTETPYWITEEWSNTCSSNPCRNETRLVKCTNGEDTTLLDVECDLTEKPIESRRCPMAENIICKKKVVEAFDLAFKTLRETFFSLLSKMKN